MPRLCRTFVFPVLSLLPLLLPGALLVSAGGCGTNRKNVILVTVAGLRADAVTPDRAPRLAALPGRVDPDVTVPVPDTAVALEALLGGRGLDELGNRFGDLFRVPADARLLAEAAGARGVRTVAFVGDGRLSELTGLARGFREYHVPSGVGDVPILPDETNRLKPTAGGAWPADRVRDAVGGWFAAHAREGPFFAWVHLGDLSAAVRADDPRRAYREALSRIDAAVGDIAGSLATWGIADRTIVAVVSLHGESLGDRGETGHGIFLSDEVTRVPAWLAGPGGRAVPVAGRPIDLGLVGRTLAREAGWLDAAADRPATDRSATWWPERLYGWPNEAPPADAGDVLRRMAEAHRLETSGRVEEARQLLRKIAAATPRGMAPRLLLARSLEVARRKAAGAGERGRIERGLGKVLAECRALARGHLARQFDLVRLLVGLGRKEEAMALAGEIDREARTEGERLALGRVYAEAGASDRAAQIIAGLVEAEKGLDAPELLTWEGDLLRRAGNTYRARQAYEAALASPRGHTPETLAKLGDCLADLGEKNEALQRYAEAVRLDPGYRYPHARAAEILLEQGKRGEAATALAMSVPDTGDPVALAVERARRMVDHGLLGPAAQELSRALEKVPGNSRLLCWLARVYTEGGKPQEARSLLDGVLATHPDNPLAWMERARIAVRAGDEEEALRCLRRAEVYASPRVIAAVRSDPLFRGKRPDGPLARFVAHFGEGRRVRHRARPAGGAR